MNVAWVSCHFVHMLMRGTLLLINVSVVVRTAALVELMEREHLLFLEAPKFQLQVPYAIMTAISMVFYFPLMNLLFSKRDAHVG